MTVRIRITTAPPSNVAPDEIREAWVGIEMPAEPDQGDLEPGFSWSGGKNAGGYTVTGIDAVKALLDAGKVEACQFWSSPHPPSSLRFGADHCEIVIEPEIIEPIKPEAVRGAVKKLAEHRFHKRMKRVTGDEAHRILPEIWPVIQELCLIADACEAGMIEVKSH